MKNAKIKYIVIAAIMAFALPWGCGNDDDKRDFDGDTYTDPRDRKAYRTVVVGNRRWMAENLDHQPKTGNSWCYDDDAAKCAEYGRLYDWETAANVCPAGWRLPNDDDWRALIHAADTGAQYLQTSDNTHFWQRSGTSLKTQKGWKSHGGAPAGTDVLEFSAQPGGMRVNTDAATGMFRDHVGRIGDPGGAGYYWSVTDQGNRNGASHLQLHSWSENAAMSLTDKAHGLSVRCVRDMSK